MGQYYMPTLIDIKGDVTSLYSHEYDNGLKLMEHSWIGNNFVNAVITQLWKNPQKVAWIGDYSNEFYGEGDAYEDKISKEEFDRYYKLVWNDETEEKCRIHPDEQAIVNSDGFDDAGARCYLVNHTTKQYIDLADYVKASVYKAKWMNHMMCVHPLPLLTACGNDRGGGDFHSGGEGYDLVGIWAFDMIELTNVMPADCEPLLISFKEKDAA